MNAPQPIGPGAKPGIGLRLTGAMLTDVGRVRSHNEDSLAFVVPAPNGAASSQDSLLLVADGMGGHAAGEVASAMARDIVLEEFYRHKGSVPANLAAAFRAANAAILEHSRSHPECAGMGTTCTALAVRDDRVWLAHVGDSRAYLLRGTELSQISHDQTLVARLVREGQLTEEEARRSDINNIILQALGTAPEIEPEIPDDGFPLLPSDHLILCSDGLYDLVPDATIAEVAGRLAPLEACQALIQHALDAGGHDNISIGVFCAVDKPADRPAPADQTTRPMPMPQAPIDGSEHSATATTRRIEGFERLS